MNSTISGAGRISPVFGLNEEVNTAHSSRASESGGITVDDLSLKLSQEGGQSWNWSSIKEFPSEQDFKVGNYTMEAYYGNLEDEGFEKPYYYGSVSFAVTENNTSHINLVSKLANSMVTVAYTDAFKSYMSNYSAKLHSAGGDYLDYAADETRAVYLRPGEVTLTVGFTTPNGTSANLEAAKFTAKAQYHYTVTVDVKEGVGTVPVLNITFDENLGSEEVNIDLSDELLNSPAPTITPVGFSDNDTFSAISGFSLKNDLKMNIFAMGGLSEVTLTTQSVALLSTQKWFAEKELISATASDQALVKSLGLEQRGLWQNPDKMAVLDLAGVVKNIAYVSGGNNTTTFTVVVKDKLGRVTDPITVNVNINELILSLVQTQSLIYGSTTAEFDVQYNGESPKDNLVVKYLKSSGSWVTAEATFTSKGDNLYHVVATVPAISATSLSFKVTCGSQESATLAIPVETPTLEVSYTENNVYATGAYVTFTTDSKYDVTPTFQVSTNGTSYTNATATKQSNGMYYISGLTAGTKTYVRATLSNIVNSDAIEFTTEAATQLPNGDMEGATSISASASNWSCYEFPDGWGTNNPMTTSQGGNFAYTRISGTIPTTDAHGGSSAALIRTIGWGSGNTAIGTVSGECKYIDAGLLHLGDSRSARPDGYGDGHTQGVVTTNDLTTGISFTTRPSAMTLWYKYTPKNSSDHGVAEIYVYDASGNVIASGSTDLTEASVYTQKKVSLTYAIGAAKAAKIYVKILSTYSDEFLTKTSDNITPPAFGGSLGKATWMGSQLYVDDIQLTY
jgi:hypothetical protein